MNIADSGTESEISDIPFLNKYAQVVTARDLHQRIIAKTFPSDPLAMESLRVMAAAYFDLIQVGRNLGPQYSSEITKLLDGIPLETQLLMLRNLHTPLAPSPSKPVAPADVNQALRDIRAKLNAAAQEK